MNVESSADKRSRESPDSTLKPEGKSLKTSGVATATSPEDVNSNTCAADTATFDGSNDAAPGAPTVRWKARDAAEAKLFVRQMHRRIPAWKLKLCTEALHASPVDLVRIAEVTEIQFATAELVDVAVQCLNEIAKEIETANASAGAPGTTAAAPSHDDKESTNDKSTSQNLRRNPRQQLRDWQTKMIHTKKQPTNVPPHRVRHSLLRLLQCNVKMPQHRLMDQSPRRRTSQQRIRLKIGSLIS